MIIFKDVVSGDEVLSDVYKMTVEGIFYKVEAKYITTKNDSIDESAIGGNASAEGGDAEAGANDSGSVSGLNVVLANRLVETGFGTKKEYQTYIKGYMAKIVKHLQENCPDRVDSFKAEAAKSIKELLPKFKDLQFFMGESMDPDAMHIIVDYVDNAPFMYYFKDGLIEEKV